MGVRDAIRSRFGMELPIVILDSWHAAFGLSRKTQLDVVREVIDDIPTAAGYVVMAQYSHGICRYGLYGCGLWPI